MCLRERGLKMCSECHRLISWSEAFGDNLYLLGRVAYVDCHLLNKRGGGILFVAGWMLLSLAFGFPYLFGFCIPHELLSKMVVTVIVSSYIMFHMDEMGSHDVFRTRQHAIVM